MTRYAVGIGGALLVLLYLTLRSVMHFVAENLVASCIAAVIGISLFSFTIWALIRGATRHTICSWPALPAVQARTLPAPVDPVGYQTSQLFAVAEPDEEDEPAGPLCTLPGCGEQVGDEFWEVDAKNEDDPDADIVQHPFCSQDHAELWAEQVRASA